MNKKYTIRDIAELAGVSKGTVDRVLHKRGKVSEDALKKVNKVLDAIDFRPNPIAKNLKNNKIYRLCLLFPSPVQDAFWQPCLAAVAEIEDNYRNFGIQIEQYPFDADSTKSFTETARRVIESAPDAILMVPLFYYEAQEISEQCEKADILISTFNNTIDAESPRNFIGQDLYQSGRIAAKLFDMLMNKGHLAVVHIDQDFKNATHMQEKERGFLQYFEEKGTADFSVSKFNIKKDPTADYKAILQAYLDENPSIDGLFITTSKTHIAADINAESNKKRTLIGYDLIEKNTQHLQKGRIDFLIHQNIKKQTFYGLRNLAEHFLFDKEIPKKQLIPIDIVTTENFKQYLL